MGIYLFSLCLLSTTTTTTTTIENFFSTFRLIKENPANIFLFFFVVALGGFRDVEAE